MQILKSLIIRTVCLGTLLLGMAGAAGATSYTDTVNLNTYLWGTGTKTWTHTTPSDFSVPPDDVFSAQLAISAALADGNNDTVTVKTFSGTLNNSGLQWSTTIFDIAEVFATWTLNEPLNVSLHYIEGPYEFFQGLYLKDSIFTLEYANGDENQDQISDNDGPGDNAPVPEPATMLLLGSGLAGLGFMGKKRRVTPA